MTDPGIDFVSEPDADDDENAPVAFNDEDYIAGETEE
jgi:hypothetical protein